ncbi:MAG: class I SAM-dependent DNA methyltransferase [Terracidiphilus sp.]|jgi:type I restriction enzyme M protein
MSTAEAPKSEPTLEQTLWAAVCEIEDDVKAPKFKDYSLTLVFLKRLNDVYEEELDHAETQLGDRQTAERLIGTDHKMVRYFLPTESRWPQLAQRTTGLGEVLTDAVRAVSRANPQLQGVIDNVDFNATAAGRRIVTDDRLTNLIQALSSPACQLGVKDIAPGALGGAFAYLLRRFAEGQGRQSRYTPPEVARLIADLLDPQPGMSIYDPCCGSAGLLVKCQLRLLETHGREVDGWRALPNEHPPLQLFGQEIDAPTYAIARMNTVIHDMEADIHLGDTMRAPAHLDGTHLRRFDLAVTNPQWNQHFPEATYRNDKYDRFLAGIPSKTWADWGWVQHMLASLGPAGRMVALLDTGAASRGSGGESSDRERAIRRALLDQDLVEAVILLADNLFYANAAPGILVLLNRDKNHPHEILFINASKLFLKGRPKNALGDDDIDRIAGLYREWRTEEGSSVIITSGQLALPANDFNLSPSKYVVGALTSNTMTLDEAVVELRRAKVAQAEADADLWKVLSEVGVE